MSDTRTTHDTQALLQSGQQAMAQGQWAQGLQLFGLAVQRQAHHAGAWHNLGVCALALGQARVAQDACRRALALSPSLWQSQLVMGKAQKLYGDMLQADTSFKAVLRSDPSNAQARVALADLYMNTFGQPLTAVALVQPLLQVVEHAEDAELTTLMAGLYDRDTPAEVHNQSVIDFSARALQLDPARLAFLPADHPMGRSDLPLPSDPNWRARAGRARPRVALISPLLCASPVYFLTIAAWRQLARTSELVVFNRGHQNDWASAIFRGLVHEWHEVQEMDAQGLAEQLYRADLDVLYDLGGWMDPVALKALSVKPVPQMFKWVGGQSVTTGLKSFDGWIGDAWQSPAELQHFFTEPLVQIPGGYATYTPPDYLPPQPKKKRDVPVIFSNPAKLSRAFLQYLQALPGRKCFVHQQFQYPQARVQVLKYLDAAEVEFVTPANHREALQVLGQHRVMLDTFPYSSGLTAQEARAMGVQVQTRVGTLFCERHGAQWASH